MGRLAGTGSSLQHCLVILPDSMTDMAVHFADTSILLPTAELHKQEFERRRKEHAENQPKKAQQRKGRKKTADGKEVSKKRPRKLGPSSVGATVGGAPAAGKQPGDMDYNAVIDELMQQLRLLPLLPLQEPLVEMEHLVLPVVEDVQGESW